jgi:hypothetical protein
VIWGALCILLGQWTGLRRFWLLGALICLAGIATGAWQFVLGMPSVSVETAVYRTFAGAGLLTLVSGVVFALSGLGTFLRYRKENPVPYSEEA